ncbi:PspC domain-containing protein [Postechiella marina]|uniref:PspC domain-containing protein n=1 Tax=Postechiella marina TaxID=943941 RepID=A0ABP8CIL9_9FLAO
MNKTVNINLAGIFFHIDEDAYLKLQRYLEAIKRSFTDSQGRSEIIADIEARIAELFNERVKNDRQVISIKEVDAVITIMGQPEDYLVDDEIFEDEPTPSYSKKSSTNKKLFRDTDNSYIGGVSSGLAHYFGIDTIWIRLAWVLLIFGAGTGILLYILLWILVPEAKTTAEKIMMTGAPVNISNIEKKIKDGFETVTETVGDVAKNVSSSVSDAVKHVDFEKQGNKIKSTSKGFFDTIGNIIMFFFKVFAKFIGVILILVGATSLIALIVGLFSVGAVNFIHIPGLDMIDVVNSGNTPVWLVSLLAFLTAGIPLFFIFYLGLKILINNLKSIGNIAKYSLFGLWIMSIIGLFIIGIRQASEHAFNESVVEKNELYITKNDTLKIKMIGSDLYRKNKYGHRDSFKVIKDDNGNKSIYRSDVRIIVKSTTDTIGSISIEKSADGRDHDKARERAKNINYSYQINRNELLLDSYLTTSVDNKFSDQEIIVYLNLPEGIIANFYKNTKSYLNYYSKSGNIVQQKYANRYIKILEDDIECLNCPIEDDENDFELKVNTPKVKINEDGIEIKADDTSLKIDNNGLKAKAEDVKVNIDANGINIETD